jgi:hypothetical protein
VQMLGGNARSEISDVEFDKIWWMASRSAFTLAPGAGNSGLLNGKPHAIRLPASWAWVDNSELCRTG